MIPQYILKKTQCIRCGNRLLQNDYSLYCTCSNKNIFFPDSGINLLAKTSLGEKIFDFPKLYNIKISILNAINKKSIPLDNLIKGKEVLDIGCGSYLGRYNPNITKRLVGIDPSAEALKLAQKLHPGAFFFVASADNLPFADKSFDVSLILFTLHHLSSKKWKKALYEANRVSRKTIIIYDHVHHDLRLPAAIQMLYWRVFDGGHVYYHQKKWDLMLKPFKIQEHYRFGSLFSHICFYHLQPIKL